MKGKIIRKKELNKSDYGVIKVIEYITKNNNKNFSLALIELNGKNRKIKNELSDAFYFVIEGDGKFFLNGEEYQVGEGDLVCIPKGTSYFDEGKLKMVSIATPPFDREYVIELE